MDKQDVIIIISGFIGSALIKKIAGRFALVGFDRVTSHQPLAEAECGGTIAII
jgi:nucleoside-diphosphate-sugar epimerase